MSWGNGGFGITPWGGGGEFDSLQLRSAVAIAENTVRLEFNTAPLFTGVLDPHDASSANRFAVTAIQGTIGYDGLPARKVSPAYALVAPVENGGGRYIDLFVDREFSPYPAQYRVTVNNLVTSEGGFYLNLDATSYLFFGVLRGLTENSAEAAYASKDIASPQTVSALAGVSDEFALTLGGFAFDSSGDLATDSGDIQRKKRALRRLFTKTGAFLHLPGYGAGITGELKKLNHAAFRARKSTDAEVQLVKEPDIAKAVVQFISGSTPGITYLKVLIKAATGESFKIQVPLKTA